MQLNPMLLSLELESSRTGEDIIMIDRSTYANAVVFSLLIILLKYWLGCWLLRSILLWGRKFGRINQKILVKICANG